MSFDFELRKPDAVSIRLPKISCLFSLFFFANFDVNPSILDESSLSTFVTPSP